MESRKQHIDLILQRPGKFLWRVLVGFKRNQGLLLAGAVAYYTLLSVIPMLALILVGLSHFIDEQHLYNTILTNLKLVIPAYAESVTGQVWGFLARRQLVGIVGILIMLFFSSMAFTVLENAMAIIFSHRARKHRRRTVGNYPPYSSLVLFDHIPGQRDLWLPGDCRGCPAEHRDRGDYLAARRSGDCGIRTQHQ